MFEADPVAAGDSERVDVVEQEVLDVSVGFFLTEISGVQHLPRRRFEMSAATADFISQMLLPASGRADGPCLWRVVYQNGASTWLFVGFATSFEVW